MDRLAVNQEPPTQETRYHLGNAQPRFQWPATAPPIHTSLFRRLRCQVQTNSKRARALGRPDTLTVYEWYLILKRFDFCCALCGDTQHPTLDHATPLSRGGRHTADNCLPLCCECNQCKGQRTMHQWVILFATGVLIDEYA